MNSRWQANKIGLINFWYYDEQEFSFVKGRMLLRGSNGSGKSVTMQSVVPLLLDGDMSPERLDPFRSRDRKMTNYLLEEEDGREERTGYIYIEFKREDSETYITVGIGMRARRGKPMDKWYFSLTDGRRIGHDFLLYKETNDKVTLTKKELANRVQTGGQLFDRQTDYMEYVNKQIFGFETIEEYKELIDLLIQLRSPKLSKDFKPTIINEILSDSLQPLSDDELRPMSEAIENMDTMTMNLKARKEGKQAAEKINRVLDKYNKIVLWEKASYYEENRKALAELQREEKENKKNQVQREAKIIQLAQEQEELNAKKNALEKEKESLTKSDVVALKHQEMDLGIRIENNQKTVIEKEKQLDQKNEQYLDITQQKKEASARQEQKESQLENLLENMEEHATVMSFEEHSFFKEELKENWKISFSFDTQESQMKKTKDRVKTGLDLLREADAKQRQVEELFRKRDIIQRDVDHKGRQILELESLFIQIQNEWKENLYRWNSSNIELILSKALLQEMSIFVDGYHMKSDYAIIRKKVADSSILIKSLLDLEQEKLKSENQEKQLKYVELTEELKEWEQHKEPEPPRSDEVIQNRKRLKDKGIPFLEFYKVLEFGKILKKEECDYLEEALLRMGILDALVVEEEYREQVLTLDKGASDHYLFIQKGSIQQSMVDVLELNDSLNDIFMNQKMMGLLGNIGYDSTAGSAIWKDGTYQLGVVTGTITGTHEAGFLGIQAREKNRLAKIEACKFEIEKI